MLHTQNQISLVDSRTGMMFLELAALEAKAEKIDLVNQIIKVKARVLEVAVVVPVEDVAEEKDNKHLGVEWQAPLPTSMSRTNLVSRLWTTKLLPLVAVASIAEGEVPEELARITLEVAKEAMRVVRLLVVAVASVDEDEAGEIGIRYLGILQKIYRLR